MAHLTHEKLAELRQLYDAFLLSVGGGAVSVQVEQLVELVKSLGGDFKWMKDAEIAECEPPHPHPIPQLVCHPRSLRCQ